MRSRPCSTLGLARLVVPLLGMVPGCFCGGGGSTGDGLTVLTLNILHGISNEDPAAEPWDRFPERLPLIAGEIARLRPSVVLLQEVLAGAPGEYPDVLGTLLDALNGQGGDEDRRADDAETYVAVFGNIFGAPPRRNEGSAMGQATLTHLPVLASSNHAVVAVKALSPRSVLHVRVAGPLGEIDVYNAHLQGPEDSAAAAKEMLDVLAFVDSTVGPQATALLGGDLNSPESAPVYDKVREAGFVDLGVVSRLECSSQTRLGCTNETFPLADPGNRASIKLDYLWLRSPLASRTRATPAFGEPARLPDGSLLWLSDHIGLWGSIRLDSPHPWRPGQEDARIGRTRE